MIRLKFSTYKLKRLVDRIEMAMIALEDRREGHEWVKRWMMDRWEVNFDGEGSIYDKWPPLAESTVKDRGGSRSPMLVRSGVMRADFVALNAGGNVSEAATTWRFINAEPWPVSHHYGINWRAHQPARTLWAINEGDETEFEDIFEDEVNEVLNRYF